MAHVRFKFSTLSGVLLVHHMRFVNVLVRARYVDRGATETARSALA